MASIIDTTVLVDALLKGGELARQTLEAIKKEPNSHLPVYAIKELKRGALRKFVYVHNKLIQLGSFAKTLAAVQKLSRTPQRYFTSTAIEALQVAAEKFAAQTPATLGKTYGVSASLDQIQADYYRSQLRLKISLAWRKRRSLVTKVVGPLSCYLETAPRDGKGRMLEDQPVACDQGECCLGLSFSKRTADLEKLIAALDAMPESRENTARRKALKILRKGRQISEAQCRDLGDAVFSLQGEPGSTIMTTNIRDHEPLAVALGLSAKRPY